MGKRTENEEAMGSLICSKNHSSLSAKFFFLLSANSAIVFFFFFFLGPGFHVFAVQELFSIFFNSYHDLKKANNKKRRAIKRRAISRMEEKQNHM